MEKELIWIIENNYCDFNRIHKLVELLLEICSLNEDVLKEYELRDKYKNCQILIDTLMELVCYKEKENKEKIEMIYKQIKTSESEES